MDIKQATDLLQIVDVSHVTVDDLPRVIKKAQKRWHPDRVAHLHNAEETGRYTNNFQLIDTAAAVVRSFIGGSYRAGSGINSDRATQATREPEEIIRENAAEMQAVLRRLWEHIKTTKYKWSEQEVVFSEGDKIRDLIEKDLADSITTLSTTSLVYGSMVWWFIAMFGLAIHPVIGGILAVGWLSHCLSCLLGMLPLTRFWIYDKAESVMLWFINFGLRIATWFERKAQADGSAAGLIVAVIVFIPRLLGLAVQYVVIMPICFLISSIWGDKVIGVIKKRVSYYGDAADWYIEKLLAMNPATMTSEQLIHLSRIYSQLRDA